MASSSIGRIKSSHGGIQTFLGVGGSFSDHSRRTGPVGKILENLFDSSWFGFEREIERARILALRERRCVGIYSERG
jgi:hypothetical protein